MDNRGLIGVFTLLDLPATLIPSTILSCYIFSQYGVVFGICWMADYLSDRCQVVSASKCESGNVILQYGVRQESVLGRTPATSHRRH